MHCELAVPGLFSAPPELRLPALELLLARGRRTLGEPLALERWLEAAFGVSEPAGAGALAALGANAGDGPWIRADPVHLRLQRDRLLLLPPAVLALCGGEAAELCAALDREFAGTLSFTAPQPLAWCARLQGIAPPEASAPLAIAGENIDEHLPRGGDATRWHSILNEAQMLLHAHPVNARREARGAPPVNSLWFWGAGQLPASAHGPWHGVLADDLSAAGLARLAKLRHRQLTPGATEWLERAPEDGRYLVVLDQLRAPLALGDGEAGAAAMRELEERWFAPLLAALRAGRIGMLTLRAPCKGVSFETVRGDLRRFWRRARPAASYA